MVLRMTGARKLSLAMSDTKHVGHVHLLGQQRTQEVTEDKCVFYRFLITLLIDC